MSDVGVVSINRERGGRFVNGGKPGPGRPVGARSKLSTQFLDDLAASWKERGAEVLRRCAEEEPGQYLRVVASLMPRELDLSVSHNVEITQILADFRGLGLPDRSIASLMKMLPKAVKVDAAES